MSASSECPSQRSTLFAAYTSTNSSGLPPSSRCSCVHSSRPVPLCARGTYRSTASITVTLRPPCLRAFYGFPAYVVNPVTIEPQYLEDDNPRRTHIQAAIQVGGPRGPVQRGPSDPKNLHTPRSLLRRASAWPMLATRYHSPRLSGRISVMR